MRNAFYIMDAATLGRMLGWVVIAGLLAIGSCMVMLQRVMPPRPVDADGRVGAFVYFPAGKEPCIEQWSDVRGGVWCRDTPSQAKTW